MYTYLTRAVLLTFIMLTVGACCLWFKSWCPTCPLGHYQSLSTYAFKETHRTSKGVRVDDSLGYGIDLELLDLRVDNMRGCIQEEMLKLAVITAEQRTSWGCAGIGFDESYKLSRGCFAIKVVAPIKSACSDWELLPIPAPDVLCQAKGLEVSADCPCRWRTVIQDDFLIITPPALYLWEIAKIWTQCSNTWASPFAKCLSY